MNDLNIRDGMLVYSSDGEKLGKVISCDADGFLVEKGFFFPKEYFVRYDHAARVNGDEVWLSMAKDQLGNAAEADQRYRTSPDREDTYVGRREARDEIATTLSEEELDVVKHQREAGEVRLRKDVITETKHIDVPVTREEVRVERVPVDRARDALPGEASFKEETISMPVREEEVEIRKRPVVKEEIRLKKDRTQHEQRADAEVRRETVDIDDSTSTTRRDDDLGTGSGLGAPGRDDDLLR